MTYKDIKPVASHRIIIPIIVICTRSWCKNDKIKIENNLYSKFTASVQLKYSKTHIVIF